YSQTTNRTPSSETGTWPAARNDKASGERFRGNCPVESGDREERGNRGEDPAGGPDDPLRGIVNSVQIGKDGEEAKDERDTDRKPQEPGSGRGEKQGRERQEKWKSPAGGPEGAADVRQHEGQTVPVNVQETAVLLEPEENLSGSFEREPGAERDDARDQEQNERPARPGFLPSHDEKERDRRECE